MDWDKNSGDDLDLWLRTPSGVIIYFGGKDRAGANLERDDLGFVNECFGVDKQDKDSCVHVNREVIMLRGLLEGEYQLKFVVYAPSPDYTGNPVTIEIIDINPYKIEFSRDFTYKSSKQNVSIIRFTIDADGNIESFSDVPAEFDINRSAVPAGSSGNPPSTLTA